MCGFVALISKRHHKVDPALVRLMNDAIVHRGPDDEGYYVNDWLALGFRRLSIIDLSQQGHQPMLDASQRYVCVFNGEIYNYRELRKTLEKENMLFRGDSDTEVLLNAYIHWGKDCLNKLIGMFAFLIVDLQNQSVFIGRDFPGIKPLYFTEDEDYFYFASEIKAFSKVMPLSVNTEAYGEQFNFRYLAGDRTLFKKVIKVLPGCYWQIDRYRRIQKKAYFNVSETFFSQKKYSSIQDIVAETQSMLRESFLLHTRSDVGYCIQLSGGVDSSYLTSVLAESQQPLDTFSIQPDSAAFDELPYQQKVVERYKTRHHTFMMTEMDYANQLERATYHLEAPIVHSGSVFLMELCRHIRHTAKVVLTGEGADELLGGYWRHKPTRYQRWIFQLQQHNIQGHCLPNIWKFGTLKKLLNEHLILYSHRYQVPELFNQLFDCDAVQNPQRHEFSQAVYSDYVNAMLAYDQQTYITSVLDRQDKLSMSYSVEARVPYCHQTLYRALNGIAGRYKIYRGERKAILKRCTEGYLPQDLVYRRKNGLRLPITDWYRNPKSVGRYLDILTDHTAKQRGLYKNDALSKAVKAFQKGDNRYAKPIIALVNLELWHRIYSV